MRQDTTIYPPTAPLTSTRRPPARHEAAPAWDICGGIRRQRAPAGQFLLADERGAGVAALPRASSKRARAMYPSDWRGDLPGLIVLHAFVDAGFGFIQPVPLAEHIPQTRRLDYRPQRSAICRGASTMAIELLQSSAASCKRPAAIHMRARREVEIGMPLVAPVRTSCAIVAWSRGWPWQSCRRGTAHKLGAPRHCCAYRRDLRNVGQGSGIDRLWPGAPGKFGYVGLLHGYKAEQVLVLGAILCRGK